MSQARSVRVGPGLLICIGAGLLGFVSGVFPWYVVTGRFAEVVTEFGLKPWTGAFGTATTAWLAVLLMLVSFLLGVARNLGLRLPGVSVIELLLSVGALILVVVTWISLPQPDTSRLAELNLRAEDVSAGPGIGLYLCFAATLLSLLGAIIALRAPRRPVQPPATPPAIGTRRTPGATPGSAPLSAEPLSPPKVDPAG